MPTPVQIHEFLELAKQHPILDVRSPGEYANGHIPGAHSLALFTDEERAIVGTAYKKVSREAAVNKGLALFGPKMQALADGAKKTTSGTIFLVHCWRGGMRSGTVAWLLELYGYKVYLLKGGYKSFRKNVLESFTEERKILVLGGKTGSGKTLVLKALATKGEQIVDLEKLAHHKGSSFGALGEKPQPTQEMFENELFIQLYTTDKLKRLWVENESSMIGNKVIPKSFFERMRSATTIFLDISDDVRLNYLTEEYGKFSKEELKDAIVRITKKLGGYDAKRALEAIDNNDLKGAFGICLVYYDKAYGYGKYQRAPETVTHYEFEELNAEFIADKIISELV
jgi:tRNA 2-selenouridine synthase